MLSSPNGAGKSSTLMSEYSVRLSEALLRSRARDAEQTARLESEIASRVKSEFIANMSHELRTPLNTVIGFSKLLAESGRRNVKELEVVEYGQLIHDAATHLLSMINDILDISKLQAGNYAIDIQELDLEDVLNAVMVPYVKAASVSSVSLIYKVAGGLPPMRGDAQKLGQAISNLVSNAVKFTTPGGHVVVNAAPRGDEGSLITVRDTGVGMDPQELEVAMAAFGQVDGAKTRWREGAGLGLPIATALIRLHGGTIDVRSAKGSGTEFSIFLPSQQSLRLRERQKLAVRHS